MKTFLSFALMGLGLALAGHAHAASLSNEECQTTDFSSGAFLHGDFSPDTKHTLHCLVPTKDGTMVLSLMQAGLPIDVKVTAGRSTLRIGGKAATREVIFPVRQDQRIDVRVDALVGGSERSGKYALFASTDAVDDPNRFALASVFNGDTMKLYPQYAEPGILEHPITLMPNKMVSVYIPPIGVQPHLRFTPKGVKPEQLAVGIIELSTGKFTPVPYRDGHFHIPLTDPDGMLLSLGSKSLQSITFTLTFKVNP